jgi:hypothetical protein
MAARLGDWVGDDLMARSNYRPDYGGLREIGSSSEMGAVCLTVAERLAGNAQAVGSGDYSAERSTVTAGWRNERRAGAVVRESRQDWEDWREAILVRVTRSMEVRAR